MSDLTDKIEEAVSENSGGWHHFEYTYPLVERKYVRQAEWEESEGSGLTVEGLGRIFFAEGYTGGEGGGSDAYQIVLLRTDGEPDRYFRKDGYYASHYGTDWDGGLYEVEPRPVTRTEYFRK